MISHDDPVMTARMIGDFYADLGEWMRRNKLGHLEDVVASTNELGSDPDDCFGVLCLGFDEEESPIHRIVFDRCETPLSREFYALLVRYGLRINLCDVKAQIFPTGRVSKGENFA